jgi:hypothetical protein
LTFFSIGVSIQNHYFQIYKRPDPLQQFQNKSSLLEARAREKLGNYSAAAAAAAHPPPHVEGGGDINKSEETGETGDNDSNGSGSETPPKKQEAQPKAEEEKEQRLPPKLDKSFHDMSKEELFDLLADIDKHKPGSKVPTPLPSLSCSPQVLCFCEIYHTKNSHIYYTHSLTHKYERRISLLN